MLLRESMGVGADSNTKAFHATDINSFLKRPPVEIYRDGIDFLNPRNTNHVVLAVDPAGGGASAFTICSMVQQANGAVVVRSLPRPSPAYCATASPASPACCCSCCSNGQLPSRSPSKSWLKITAMKTYESGAWHECRRKGGSIKGRMRLTMSFVKPESCWQKYCPSSGSRRIANKSAARLLQIPPGLQGRLAIDRHSLAASCVASVSSP